MAERPMEPSRFQGPISPFSAAAVTNQIKQRRHVEDIVGETEAEVTTALVHLHVEICALAKEKPEADDAAFEPRRLSRLQQR